MKSSFLLWVLRVIFLITMLGVATRTAYILPEEPLFVQHPSPWWPILAFLGVMCFAGLVIAADINTKGKQLTTISAVYFGLLLGLLFGSLFASAVEPLLDKLTFLPLRIIVTLFFCYICVSTLLQTKDDFRFIIPYVEFSKQVKGGRSLVLDTSVIIDGRIADICDTKIIDTKMWVPRFVLHELQGIADSSDRLRRNRGRRGMDMLKKMQSNPKVDLQIHEGNLTELEGIQEVDQRLVVLAKSLNSRVVTNDFNLNKVAQLQGVEVININELANALKSVALPGEVLKVKVIKLGDQPGQGVGYLDDGTMVVVEQGRTLLNQDINLVVTSILQTPAGRMIFGRSDTMMGGKTGMSSAHHQAFPPDGTKT